MFWKEKKGYCIEYQNIFGEKGKCELYALRNEEETTTIDKLNIAINDLIALEKIYDIE